MTAFMLASCGGKPSATVAPTAGGSTTSSAASGVADTTAKLAFTNYVTALLHERYAQICDTAMTPDSVAEWKILATTAEGGCPSGLRYANAGESRHRDLGHVLRRIVSGADTVVVDGEVARLVSNGVEHCDGNIIGVMLFSNGKWLSQTVVSEQGQQFAGEECVRPSS